MDFLQTTLKRTDSALSVVRTNPYISGVLTLVLILYAGLAAPALPSQVAKLFDNSVVKMSILVLIVMLVRNQDFSTALLVALAFMLSVNTLSHYRMFDMAAESASRSSPSVDAVAGPSQASCLYGPNSLLPEDNTAEAEFHSTGETHEVRLRGYRSKSNDVPILLPGGHGDADINAAVDVGYLKSDDAFPGYEGKAFASIGTEESQL